MCTNASVFRYSHRRPGDKTPDPGYLGDDVEMWLPKVEEPVKLVDLAIDSRPFAPGLVRKMLFCYFAVEWVFFTGICRWY